MNSVQELLAGRIEEALARLKQLNVEASDPASRAPLLEIVTDPDQAELLRTAAAAAMGRCRTSQSRAELTELADSPNDQLRQYAAVGLGDDDDVQSILTLIRMLTDDLNKVRNLAERSLLKRTGQLAEVGVEPLLNLLDHPVKLTRAPAARLLGQTQDERSLKALLQLLNADDWLDRMWAVKGLADFGDSRAVEGVSKLLQHDPKNRVRAAAAEAIATLKADNAAELLAVAAESDDDPGVRTTAHESLLSLGFEAEETEVDPFAED